MDQQVESVLVIHKAYKWYNKLSFRFMLQCSPAVQVGWRNGRLPEIPARHSVAAVDIRAQIEHDRYDLGQYKNCWLFYALSIHAAHIRQCRAASSTPV